MFEAMKNFMINVVVLVQTGMGPNYVFNSTKEMADYSRAWLDAYYATEDLFSIMPMLLAGIVIAIVTIIAVKAVVDLFYAED